MTPLHILADRIRVDWGAKINYAAKPYVDAMSTLSSVDDNYIFDSGFDIVARFLANAGTWRGQVARETKAELNKMIGR